LIDGADGIASTAGAIICASLACLATLGDLGFEATVAAAMAAALLGFLCFNWPPAKIYLGDSGSMLIGLVVGVFSIWANLKHSATIAFAVPLAALTVPMFDSGVAIVRRVLTGRSIYSADRGHLHHRLSSRFSPKGMLLIVAGLCLLTGLCAVFSVMFRMQWIALVGTACVIVGLVLSGLFGAAESRMILQRGSRLLKSFFTRARKADETYLQQSVHLQGSTRWDEIWEALTDFSKKHSLSHLRLDLNLSYRHEGYHGEWRAVRQPERPERWSIFLPVFSRGHAVGKLEIAGRAEGSASLESLETLAVILQDLEPAVERLIAELDSTVADSTSSAVSETIRLEETPDLEGAAGVLARMDSSSYN
jgi:UDP-GlcNAc:undecaprenyl-phosphate GlcNAc-1-phosphate transferase